MTIYLYLSVAQQALDSISLLLHICKSNFQNRLIIIISETKYSTPH
ncbi:hypothetical protein MAQ5080_02635 [Marinomonas aquimarina]|uniref:Uncharacterized protein n=1 Tax=Marinomonas aquimarina TaxID=295068 RepID=A0A1A8TJK6_9GAMM|nr:hypothetical protein MAQ5080_02635 [Marinomonas aquimarina]